MLIEQGVPLPQSLSIAGRSSGDVALARAGEKLAVDAASAHRPSENTSIDSGVPPLLNWMLANSHNQTQLSLRLPLRRGQLPASCQAAGRVAYRLSPALADSDHRRHRYPAIRAQFLLALVHDDEVLRAAMSSTSPSPSNPFEHRLSDRQSWELGAELAALAQAGVPLTSGLRNGRRAAIAGHLRRPACTCQ